MSSRKTESASCSMLPGTSNLGAETVASNTSPLVDVDTRGTSEVAHTGSFLKFFNTNGVLSIFGRGFLAEPVLRDEEESYRYLMALDRY
ncbi:hypothetical protein X798_03577 [Onchocerca flexuosa]|uniref:BTB_2 domain-containing protein n=2 Tax=Onchocerca flexuosa TaxID=387005 RepID=A0A183H0F8_9BILA|nr:hypothetical protein X798_03577 [Onchocerca flexuosa]VDO27742.1 unnamed protein product [Onchocerca flexuosa]